MIKSESSTFVLKPPESVRGMTKLEKDKFSISVDFPALEIDNLDVGLISRRVRLEKFLIGHKMKPLKPVVDSESPGKKYLLFHPEKVINEETKQEIKSMLERELGEQKMSVIEWKTKSKEINFENWDTKTLISSILPENLDFSSYTQTGHIVHCNFKDDLLPYRFVIGEVLLNKIQACRTVVQKDSIITNVYRNLNLELIAGEENYITELKEEGLRYKLDFSKVYWNSRLSHEHARLISIFNKQSLVYDACCGIGPFVLPAYAKRKPRRIIANDLNPDSVKYLKINIDLNKFTSDAIEVHNMDANLFIKSIVADDVVREMNATTSSPSEEENPTPSSEVYVVMNLPAYAVNFLPAFRGVLKEKNISKDKSLKWNVYCYLFAKSHVDVDDDWYEKEARRMCDEKTKWETSLVEDCHLVRTVSSRKEMFCVHLVLPYEYLTADPLPENELGVQVNEEEEVDEEDGPACKKSKQN